MKKILSINTAQPVQIPSAQGPVLTGIYKRPIEGLVEVTALGISNDTIADTEVHGGLDQAVYVYHSEDYEWWSQELDKTVPYGAFGENLTIFGLAQTNLIVGDRLRVGAVVFEITAPRIPCFKLGHCMGDQGFVKKFAQAGRSGFYLRVICAGKIRVGDEIEYQPTSEDYVSVKELFEEWYRKNKSKTLIAKALNSPLASVHKSRVQQWDAEA